MFSRNKVKLESFIGSNTRLEGEIKMNGTLRVDGKVNGNIETDWLILGDKASLRGDVTANGIIVGGMLEGNLTAREIVEIKHNGRVNGDVLTSRLTVAEGGFINGRVSMQMEETKVVELTQKIK
jgi:cytoskeletal protein CcmA (bactofilin family)